MLAGDRVVVLVVGGGAVGERKARQFLAAGAQVTVIAPEIGVELERVAVGEPRLTLVKRRYEPSELGEASLVIAATNDAATNAAVARDADALGRLVNVVDDPDAGTFTTCAIHRAGDLTVGVSAGRVPAAAAAIAAEIGRRFDGRYERAIRALRGLRDRLLAAGKRDDWQRASDDLIGPAFVGDVEAERIEGKAASWR